MFAQLPFEIVDHIVGELAFEDVRSIARVCSAFRLPAQIRLFRTIKVKDPSKGHIDRIESILSSPHLLQYPSNLLVHCNSHDSIQHPSIQLLWAHLPVMSRLIDVYISDPSGDYSRVLSALESLGSRREIALTFGVDLAPDLRISNNPLPIHTLELWVDTPNHQVATRLIQKCSQSLRYLRLNLQDGKTPPLPFLPHLSEFFAVDQKMRRGGTEPDLMSLSPFLDQHPTITRLILGSGFTLSRQPPPNLLPNLQYLEATPLIISRLIPGRPVNGIDAEYVGSAYSFPPDIMLQPFRQSFVPVTSLGIIADTDLPNDSIVDMVRSLPKLGKFTLLWYCNYEEFVALEGLLTALGGCKDIVHIRLELDVPFDLIPRRRVKPTWSRDDFVQMVRWVQENGAAGLWSFELRGEWDKWREGGDATRVGWLDVPSQPTLRGEWKFNIIKPPSDSYIPKFA